MTRPSSPGRSWFRWTLRVLALLVVVVIGTLAVTAYRVWSVAREDHRDHSDVVIVLGASQFNGRPSEVFAARLRHAADLYKSGVAKHVLTVGGKREGDRYTEAAAGEMYLHGLGIPSSALVAVGQGSDTLTSLRAADGEVERRHWRTAVLVTDPWHSLRSRAIARDLGIDATTSPARTGPAVGSRRTEAHYIVRETGAYLYYRLLHRSSDSGDSAV